MEPTKLAGFHPLDQPRRSLPNPSVFKNISERRRVLHISPSRPVEMGFKH
ncbi:MAG: hypothetical protein FGF51_07440 [Candidatus Brockarchaeota archaeon]|nr:hypothetical protein [Candidatus Brockarchaeota archaeon]